MNSNRLRPRRFEEPERGSRRRAVPPPGQAPDRTGLYVGLAVGGGILVLALAFAMSSDKSQEPGRVDRSADRGLKEDMEAAQKLAGDRKLADALYMLEAAIQNPAYRSSNLLPKARAQADQYRKQIAFEKEAVAAIDDFDRRVTASKADKTAMQKADAFYRECNELLAKYSSTFKAPVLKGWQADLERWRGTNAQSAWEVDYNRTKARIKKDHLEIGNYRKAIQEWRHFAEPFDSPDLKARVQSELVIINRLAKEEATKLVADAGTGAAAKAKLEEALDRFNETDGQAVITQKLKSIPF